jgi:hypothetical protein
MALLRMHSLLLDCHIYDRLAIDQTTRDRVKTACAQNLIRVLVNPVILGELKSSPFGDIPDFFPLQLIADSVVVPGLAIPGLARPGKGKVFADHIGTSKQGKDAVIADSASNYADVFVSDDRRCRTRLQQIGTSCKCFTYPEFSHWIKELLQA